jgi:hypothetical protein
VLFVLTFVFRAPFDRIQLPINRIKAMLAEH